LADAAFGCPPYQQRQVHGDMSLVVWRRSQAAWVNSVMCEVGQRQHHHQAGNEEEGQAEDLDLAHLDRRHLDTRVERPVIGLDLGAGRRVPDGGWLLARVGLIGRVEFVFGVAVDASE
jgi:hypothetical protein